MPPPKTIFTSHERNTMKTTWGSQTSRLTRDSFLPFGSCALCLLPAVDPVCCPSGDLFCRECAMTNLLAQRKEIKRLEKAAERRKEEEEEQTGREDEEARVKAVMDFEMVQQGLEVRIGRGGKVVSREGGKIVVEKAEEEPEAEGDARGKKRKFEIDEEELKRIATEERSRAKLALSEEKRAAKGSLPSFWVPGEIQAQAHKTAAPPKHTPTCPSSTPTHPHPLSLKTLTTANFTTDISPKTNKPTPTCPSCRKTLSNASKAIIAIPCGHVLCKPCVDKFLRPEHRHQRGAHDVGPEPETVHCFVCDADLTEGRRKDREGKKERKDKEKGVKPGLVEIKSEGTGFASGGKAVVKRDGVAFQV